MRNFVENLLHLCIIFMVVIPFWIEEFLRNFTIYLIIMFYFANRCFIVNNTVQNLFYFQGQTETRGERTIHAGEVIFFSQNLWFTNELAIRKRFYMRHLHKNSCFS